MYDLIVVGAGLGGASLAHQVARLGWSVLLLEKETLPRHKVCGEFLSPEAMDSLTALGLAETIRQQQPIPIMGARLFTRRTELVVPFPTPGYGLSRWSLDGEIVTAAISAGATVITATVTDLKQSHEGWQIHLRSGEQLMGRAVVGAWGRQASSRLRASQSKAGRSLYVGVKCHLDGVEISNRVEMALMAGGYVGLAPVSGDRVNLAALLTAVRFRSLGASVEGLLAAMVELYPALRGARLVPGTTGVIGAVDVDRANTPWGQVALVGDAATMIPPLCGDGMAMALRSAELIAPLVNEHLHERLSIVGWRTAYVALWHREFASRLKVGRAIHALLLKPVLTDPLLHIGRLFPLLATQLFKSTRGSRRGNTQP